MAANKFNISSEQIIAVSAFEKYNLGALVEAIIEIVPNEKKLGFLQQIETDIVTDRTQESVVRGVINYLKIIYEEAVPYIPTIVKALRFAFKLWRGL